MFQITHRKRSVIACHSFSKQQGTWNAHKHQTSFHVMLFLYIAPPKGQKPEKPLYSQEVSLGDQWKIRGCNQCTGFWVHFVCVFESSSSLHIWAKSTTTGKKNKQKKHNKLLQIASFKQHLEFSGATEQLHFQSLTSESPESKEIKISKFYIFTLFEGVK